MNITIRPTTEADLPTIYKVQAEAFGYEKEAILTRELLADPTAEPRCSLLAFDGDTPVGHIIFTKVTIQNCDTRAAILAPLAVIPEMQRKGIGGKLIAAGLQHLNGLGYQLAFVLGHIAYYPKYGFIPAFPFGLQPPYPIPDEFKDAWMVQAVGDEPVHERDTVHGTVMCCHELNKPEHWRE